MSKVPNNPSEIPEKSSVITADAITADARQLVIFAAGPRGWEQTREAWLSRSARRLGLTYRRARALFYGERIALTPAEYLTICQRAAELERQTAQEKAAQDDARDALARARAALAISVVSRPRADMAQAVGTLDAAGDAGRAAQSPET